MSLFTRISNTLALVSLGTAMSFALAGEKTAETPTENAEVYAVKFHADWCGSCKAIGTTFEELEEKFDTLPVLYVTLDHTRQHNRTQSRYLAERKTGTR